MPSIFLDYRHLNKGKDKKNKGSILKKLIIKIFLPFMNFAKILSLIWAYLYVLLAIIGLFNCLLQRKKKYLLLYLLFNYLLVLFFIRAIAPVLLVCLIVYLFCGDIMTDFWQKSNSLPKLKISCISLIFVYSLICGNSINLLMLQERRYKVEEWMISHIESPANLAYVGFRLYHPRFNRLKSINIQRIKPEDLLNIVEEKKYSYVVTTSGYSQERFPSESKKYQGFKKLYNTSKYKLVFQRQSLPLWNCLNLEKPTAAEFSDKRFKTGNFNLKLEFLKN